ncbi:hypothetical protein GS506_12515 [Rhodococcus hoagii]|nr:hypothetical protein [Prescottella equi]
MTPGRAGPGELTGSGPLSLWGRRFRRRAGTTRTVVDGFPRLLPDFSGMSCRSGASVGHATSPRSAGWGA